MDFNMILKVLNPSFIFRINKETHIYLFKLEIFYSKIAKSDTSEKDWCYRTRRIRHRGGWIVEAFNIVIKTVLEIHNFDCAIMKLCLTITKLFQ